MLRHWKFSHFQASVMKSHAAYLLSAPATSPDPELSHLLLLLWNPSARAELSAEISASIQHWDLVFTAQTPSPHLPSMWSGLFCQQVRGLAFPCLFTAAPSSKSPVLVWKHAILPYSTLSWDLQIPTWFTEELRPDLVIVLISISAKFLQNIKCTQK